MVCPGGTTLPSPPEQPVLCGDSHRAFPCSGSGNERGFWAGLLEVALSFVSPALDQSVTMSSVLAAASPRAPPALPRLSQGPAVGLRGLCVSRAAAQPINPWGPAQCAQLSLVGTSRVPQRQ